MLISGRSYFKLYIQFAFPAFELFHLLRMALAFGDIQIAFKGRFGSGTEGIHRPWNGRTKVEPHPLEVYVWHIEVEACSVIVPFIYCI